MAEIWEIHGAVQTRNARELDRLIQNGVDVNARDGKTPLHTAALLGYDDMAARLLAAHADPNLKDGRDGRCPLHEAVRSGSADLVRDLIQHGAQIDAQDRAGLSPLHHAAEQDQLKCAQILLAAGADHRLRDNAGQTPSEAGRAAMRDANWPRDWQGAKQANQVADLLDNPRLRAQWAPLSLPAPPPRPQQPRITPTDRGMDRGMDI